MQSKPCSVRVIAAYEVLRGIHQVRQERHIACQAIELGNAKRGAMQATERECACELRAITLATRLDLADLFDDRVSVLRSIGRDSCALPIEPQSTRALALAGNPNVCYKLSHLYLPRDMAHISAGIVRCR